MKRISLPLICALVLAAASANLHAAPGAVEADRLFVTPGQACVSWTATKEDAGKPTAYTLRDYHGRRVQEAVARVSHDGKVTAEVSLAAGYYEIELSASGRRIGLVALPAFDGPRDPFFAIDSALSWLVRGDDTRAGLVRVLGRSGIGMSRERLSWDQINPTTTGWDWNAGRHFDTLRQAYARHNVQVLEMFHNAPAWTGRVEKYPDDLVATARAWQEIARHWRSTWGALEIWNEPEISFGGSLPADQYVPLVKAIDYGLHEAGIRVPLVGGVFAHGPRWYLDAAAANGLLQGVDAVSFHTYDRAERMQRVVTQYRTWLSASGHGATPLWITECGRPWRRGPDRPPVDQDAASALDITMKAVEARACGVARYFPFVYPYYEERENNFGMMDRQATPLRPMAAYVQLVRRLAGMRYLGDLRVDNPAIQRARVFGDGRQTVCVLYTAKVDLTAKTRLAVPVAWAEGIDGRKLETAGGEVSTADGLTYVGLRGDVTDRLITDAAAMQLAKLGQAPPASRKASGPIVLRFQFDAQRLSPSPAGYRLAADDVPPLALTVRAFNLGRESQNLTLTASLPAERGRILDEPTRPMTVAGGGTADVTWSTNLAGAFALDERLRVTVTAAGKAGPSQLAFDLLGEAPLPQVLDRFAKRLSLPVGDDAHWRPAISRNGQMTLARTAEGHRRLEARFGAGDRWVYPQFRLPEDVDLSRWSALVFRARTQGQVTPRVFLWEGSRGVGYLAPAGIIAADGKWHVAVVRFADLEPSSANAPDANGRLDLKDVRRISLGMNSQSAESALEFGDVWLVGK
jgi:hypothetical protein